MLLAITWPTAVGMGTGFLLGCRHGLDWDHVAAITDLTASGGADDKRFTRRPVGLAAWYCVGHGLVIAVLGAAVGVLGIGLPEVLDRTFEVVVGTTLVLLGALVLWQVGRDRSSYRLQGRWRPVVAAVRRAWARGRRRGVGPRGPLDDVGRGTAFAIGVLHGTGAETPTQVVLFASAGAAGSAPGAALILLAFIAGLITCDVVLSVTWLVGRIGARRAARLELGLGLVTGLSSTLVGAIFVTGHSGALPALFGG